MAAKQRRPTPVRVQKLLCDCGSGRPVQRTGQCKVCSSEQGWRTRRRLDLVPEPAEQRVLDAIEQADTDLMMSVFEILKQLAVLDELANLELQDAARDPAGDRRFRLNARLLQLAHQARQHVGAGLSDDHVNELLAPLRAQWGE